MTDRCKSAIIFAVVAVGIGPLAQPAALGQESSSAKGQDEVAALLEQGTELRRAGRDEEALHVFERAQAQHPSPKALAQVALAEHATGRWVAADRDLVQALTFVEDPWITRNRGELAGALAKIRAHLGQLEILGSPPGATVLLNGAPVGKLPLAAPLTVTVGEAVAGLAADGYTPLSRKVTIESGRLTREVIDLPTLETANGATGSSSLPPLIGGASRPASQSDAVDDSSWTWRRRAAIGATGVGVVGLGLGIGFGLSSMSKHDDAAKVCPGACRDQHGVDLWDQARSAGNVSTVAFIVAAAGLAGGAALWFISPSSPTASPTQIGLGLGTLQMKGTW